MGAERLGEIKEICDIVKPKYGIITAIGPQHLETFKSLKNIIKTKFELADAVRDNGGKVFLNFGNEYIAKHDIKQEFASYGINDKQLDFAGLEIETSSRGSDFKIHDKSDKKTVSYNTKLIGAHNVINIVGAVAAAKELGVSLDDAVRQVKQIESVEHRLQLTRKNGFNIIDDSYNSNPVSSKKAVDTLAQFDGVKILVTPGMIELGKDERDYNYEFGKYAADYCDYVFLVNSRQAEYIYDGLKSKKYDESKIYRVSSPTEAVDKALKLGIKEEITILLENDLPDNY
jgi:UDP-N-acetylmuramoyl-tripeptide--D-alanyl-D-alanine ligase